MGFFDKINNSMIVIAFKQLSDREDCEIFCTNVPQVDTFRFIVNRIPQDSQVGESSPHSMCEWVMLDDNDQCGVCLPVRNQREQEIKGLLT